MHVDAQNTVTAMTTASNGAAKAVVNLCMSSSHVEGFGCECTREVSRAIPSGPCARHYGVAIGVPLSRTKSHLAGQSVLGHRTP